MSRVWRHVSRGMKKGTACKSKDLINAKRFVSSATVQLRNISSAHSVSHAKYVRQAGVRAWLYITQGLQCPRRDARGLPIILPRKPNREIERRPALFVGNQHNKSYCLIVLTTCCDEIFMDHSAQCGLKPTFRVFTVLQGKV